MGHNFSVKAPAFPQLSNTLGGSQCNNRGQLLFKALGFL